MNRCGVLALLSSSLLIPFDSMASFYDPVDGQFDMGHHIAENATGFLPIPILITEPAVGYGGGVAGLFLHESDEEKLILSTFGIRHEYSAGTPSIVRPPAA